MYCKEMDKVIFLSKNVEQKLEKVLQDSESRGFLVGWQTFDNSTYISGCVSELKESNSDDSINNFLPSGIRICGSYGNKSNPLDTHFSLTEDKLGCNVEYEVLSDLKIKEQFLLNTEFHITGKITWNIKVKNGKLESYVDEETLNKYAYYLKEHNIIISSNSLDELPTNIFNKKSSKTVSVKLVQNLKSESNIVPTLKYENQDSNQFEIPICVDVLCYANQNTTANQLYSNFDQALSRHLNSTFSCLETFMTTDKEIGIPKCHHFVLPQWCHPVSIFYPQNMCDDDLLTYRKDVLHQRFLELCTRPIFRKRNAIDLTTDQNKFILTNVHVGLKDPVIIDGKNHLIHGTYSYHHYMQDKIDDNGWGCAYRSLQTIISWFVHQGYTSKTIPTHKEIQQILVNVGDKPKEFVGTRKWIGSIEVSNVLNEYLGVTSKIMFVSQGAELASRGRELSMHFEKQGTPVMIGGGVLAHTILGVRFSETSGETRFLILDPHYTGSEDLKTIQDKGWCGWKAPSFWNQTAYYNLCLPQTPDVF